MKELSIEEKAKRYDEALKAVKNLREVNPSDEGIQNWVNENFPELKESEDESLRKAIHIYLDWLDGRKDYQPKGEYSIRDMIAWLEKQGEHQKFVDSIQIGDKVTRNRDGVLVNLSQLNRVAKKDEKQGEQKPAWSEEDETILKILNELVDTTPSKDFFGSTKEKCIFWLKSLKDRVQPKQEWSEEDEEMYKEVLTDIIYAKNDLKVKECLGLSKRAMKAFNWFSKRYKSLKPQSRWKPSDEQINALQTAILIVGDLTSTASLLKEIREQLKNLRNE